MEIEVVPRKVGENSHVEIQSRRAALVEGVARKLGHQLGGSARGALGHQLKQVPRLGRGVQRQAHFTYDVILELAAANGIPFEIRRVSKADVFDADELLLTSSTKEVLAITTLDGKPIGNGKPGTMFAKLHALYQTFKREVMRK